MAKGHEHHARGQSLHSDATGVKDPVCGMGVVPGEGAGGSAQQAGAGRSSWRTQRATRGRRSPRQ
jgi:hypothetical protein